MTNGTVEEKIAEIEKMQGEMRERAVKAEKEGDRFLCVLLRHLANILESDKLFRCSDELLAVYREVIRRDSVEINGMKWPIDTFLPNLK